MLSLLMITKNIFMKKNEECNPDYFGSCPDNYSHKHDYPIEEIWNTDNVLAQLISPRLQAFKALDKHGCPPECKDMCERNSIIQKMIDAKVKSEKEREKV